MEIEPKGGNCVTIAFNKTVIVVDPKFSRTSLKDARVHILTQPEFGTVDSEAIVIDGPGEYEVGGVSIKGVAAKEVTIYRVYADDFSVVVLGQVAPDLNEEQLEAIGVVDVAILPIGATASLSVSEAVQLVRKVDPKIVIPIYSDEQEAQSLAIQLGAKQESLNKLKLKQGTILDGLTVYLFDKK